MGFLQKIAHFGGEALKKVGQVGGKVAKGIGVAKAVYNAANKASGGLIGNTLENLPVVGGALKTAGKVLGNEKFQKGLMKASIKAEDIGGAIEKISKELPP